MDTRKWRLSKTQWILIAGLGGLLILRAALPSIGLYFINKNLKNLGEYTASIEDFDLSIYRGAYQFQEFDLKKKGEEESLLTIHELDLGISWRALFQGKILATVEVWSPDFKYRTSTKAPEPEEEGESSTERLLNFLLPIEVNRMEVRAGRLEWVNMDLGMDEGVYLSQIDIDARALRIQPSDSEGGPFWLKAKLMGEHWVYAAGTLNLLSDPLIFDVDLKLERFDMTRLNPMLRGYVPIDLKKGFLTIAGEAAQSKEKFDGYITIGLEDGDIIAPEQDYKSVKHFFFEILGAIGNFFLQNSSDEVTVTFPLEKTADGYKVNTENIVDKVLEGPREVEIQNSVSFEKLSQ